MKRFIVFALLGILALLVVSPASAQTENLLIDPGFEGEIYNVISIDPSDDTRFHVPSGWSGGIIRTPGTPIWINAHPSGFPHSAGFKIQGGRSFHVARGGATFTAYIYQQVYTQPGSPLEGGAWAYVQNDRGGRVRAGIDPTGGADPFSANVVWGSWSEARNGWVRVHAAATAQGGTATLLLYATQDTPSDPNGVYWDDAYFNGIRGVAPAQPGAVPVRPMVTANSNIRVRRGPGIDTPRIGAMNAGESYPLVEDLGNWYGIEFQGQTGYVSSLYTSIGQGSSAAPAGGGGSAPVTTGAALDYIVDYTLRMRVAPGRDSAEVAVIPHTATVQAVARSADSNWLLVNYNGQSGWVASWIGRLLGAISDLPVR
jgi:uncharacterized protein YraI